MNHFFITPELPQHRAAVDALNEEGFGRERFRKTVYRLRGDVPAVASLSLVALDREEQVVGSLRFWPVLIGAWSIPALLLGPLVVSADMRGSGIGAALMNRGLGLATHEGHEIVLLVGDEPYYRRFGFKRSLARNISLPGPVDAARFLGRELVPGSLEGVTGMMMPQRKGERRVATPAGRAA